MAGSLTQIDGTVDEDPVEEARETNSWLDPRYVVVFAKDGDTLGSCKSFKMNVQELISKYEVKRPPEMIAETKEHRALKNQFAKRAYKELLEYCSDHLFD